MNDPRVIRTNDGWMTFLVITLILLTSTFYTMYYLNLKAQDYINPISTSEIVSNPLDTFEEKEKIADNNDNTETETKSRDIKTLLEEKRAKAALEKTSTRPSKEELKPDFDAQSTAIEEKEFKPSDVMGESFYVVNHVFTYDNVFKPEDSGESTFVPGSTAYLFVEMYNLEEDASGEIDLAIDFKLLDESGKLMPGYDAKDLVIFKGKPPYKEGYFLARMSIPLKDTFTPGKYYTDLVIKDKISGITKEEKWVIRIKEPTL